jgi:small GTP-binding protein
VIGTLEGPLAALRESEVRLLTDIATTLAELGDATESDRQRLLDVAHDLRDAFFLVVVIGEFNAGKSSFINALLGDDLLPVGVTPTTEAIEVIKYNETVNRKPELHGSLREWTHPGTGAPGVAIVDTPGTGSVFQRHEDTAKAFLHRSDLIIFLLSAKRALADTERLYLQMARDYGKKIILVINQVDLLSPQEQADVRRFVERQVQDLLGLQPLIFMVSAREALNAQRNGTAAASDAGGIGAVRGHLRGVLAEAPPAKQKLLAQLDLAERILNRYTSTVKSNLDLVSADTGKVRDVQTELEQQALGLDKQLKGARLEIDRVFDGLRQRGAVFIETHMSVRRIGRSLDRNALQAEFQDVVIGRALRDINEATADYINALVDHSRLYWRGVIERLNQLRDLMEQELAGLDSAVYAEQRETLEQAIHIAQNELKSYSSGQVLADLQATFENNMGGFMTSSVAAVGGLLVAAAAVAAHGPLVGAAAAAFAVAVPIALGGSFLAYRYYRRVTADAKRDLNERIDVLQATFHQALDNLTQRERNRLTQYGQQVLMPVFSRLEVLTQRYNQQQTTLRQLQGQIELLRKGIKDS